MIRRPPRSTLDRSSAASDVYKRQLKVYADDGDGQGNEDNILATGTVQYNASIQDWVLALDKKSVCHESDPVSYTHLRAHETVLDIVCRLLLEKKNKEKAVVVMSRLLQS